MHPSHLIYKASNTIQKVNDKEIDYTFQAGEVSGDCLVCGQYTEKGFSKKGVIKPTFNNWQDCKMKNSLVVCEKCTFAAKFKTFRNYSFYADETSFKHCILKEFKDVILNAKPPFVFCIAVSGQKHIWLKSKVCTNANNFVVNLEETQIKFKKKEFIFLMDKVEYLYNHECKFTKDEIKKLEFNSSKILKFGIDNYMYLMIELEQYKESKLLELCVHIAQKNESEEAK